MWVPKRVINARRHLHRHRHLQENQRQGLWEAFKRSCRHRWTAVCFWRIIPRIVSYRKEHRIGIPENNSMYWFGWVIFVTPFAFAHLSIKCLQYPVSIIQPRSVGPIWPMTHGCHFMFINFNLDFWHMSLMKSSKPEVANKNWTVFNYRIVSVKYRSVPHFFVATQPLFAN